MSLGNAIARFFRRAGLVTRNIVGLPLVGEFKGRFFVEPPKLPTRKFGRATRMPTLLEILVSDEKQWPLDIGKKVNDIFFSGKPPIVFNVCFCCARPSLFRGGNYANPRSHWFNVFFGFYEIDVPKSSWDKPFGFVDAQSLTPDFEELARIGKSDWNYFSNYIYGVPGDECAKYDAVPQDGISTEIIDSAVEINKKQFVEAKIEGVEVVSGYVSKKDGKRLLNNNSFFSPIWRTVFGRPRKKKAFATSFIPTRMKMQFLARYEEGWDADLGEDAYKTFIYGGTVNMDYKGSVDNDAFLGAQMTAVKKAIKIKEFKKRRKPAGPAAWRKRK